ncbi:MAG: WbqC family protein [Bacteroidetes bacterium]|nr:WbqC family protein [Bacteroidota bacterium]
MENPILLSTAYLPPIEYIIQCMNHKTITIELLETFPKQTYRNRCHIATANGLLALTIPVKKPNGNHTPTQDILLETNNRWNIIHWRAIHSAYSHSPYFLYYSDAFEGIYRNPPKTLVEFNEALLKVIFKLLKVEVEIKYTNDFVSITNSTTDLRNLIHPKQTFDYQSKPVDFKMYTQTFNNKYPFIPNLSIIDLLFNEGSSSLDYL